VADYLLRELITGAGMGRSVLVDADPYVSSASLPEFASDSLESNAPVKQRINAAD
jgi:hypothetical protein